MSHEHQWIPLPERYHTPVDTFLSVIQRLFPQRQSEFCWHFARPLGVGLPLCVGWWHSSTAGLWLPEDSRHGEILWAMATFGGMQWCRKITSGTLWPPSRNSTVVLPARIVEMKTVLARTASQVRKTETSTETPESKSSRGETEWGRALAERKGCQLAVFSSRCPDILSSCCPVT